MTGMASHPSRRRVLAFAAAFAAAPRLARAQGRDAWAPAREMARRHDRLNAMIILHRGETALAERFRGPGLDQPVNVKSVSKTFVAALTGAAIDRDILPGLDATLGDVAPGLIPPDAESGVAGITLADLVTMQAGLERTSGPNYGEWVASRNWVADALGRPFVTEPGRRMAYSTGSFHVLGAVLTEVSGRSLLDLSRAWIGAPLGIEIPPWTRDPQGYYLGGNEMALSPDAMARFGEMYRRGGQWRGTEVLSADWVERSFRPRTRSSFSGLDYGYGWFLGRAAGHDFALARGYGGQLISILPDLELTVAITSDPGRPARSGGYFGDLLRLIERDVVPVAEAA